MSGEATLTPFVATLREEAIGALVSMVGFEPEAVRTAVLRVAPPEPWIAELEVVSPTGRVVSLDVFDAASSREAWFRTTRFAWAYRSTEGPDPFADRPTARWLNGWRGDMEARDTPEASTEVQSYLAAFARLEPFLPLRDEEFRFIFRGNVEAQGIVWLGFGCNQDCGVCLQGRRWPSPPLELYRTWVDEIAAAGVRRIAISGGEPTVHPALPELIARAAGHGARVILETNAVLLADPSWLMPLIEAGLQEVFISLHAADARISDAFTRTPGSHAQTVAGIESCIAAGLTVDLHCVVTRATAPRLKALADFVVRRFGSGVRWVSFSYPQPAFDRAIWLEQVPSLDDVRGPLTAAISRLRAAGIDARFHGASGFPLCAVSNPIDEAARLPVLPEEASHGRTKVGACDACELRDRCVGLSDSYLEVHGEAAVRPARPGLWARLRRASS